MSAFCTFRTFGTLYTFYTFCTFCTFWTFWTFCTPSIPQSPILQSLNPHAQTLRNYEFSLIEYYNGTDTCMHGQTHARTAIEKTSNGRPLLIPATIFQTSNVDHTGGHHIAAAKENRLSYINLYSW